MSIQRVLYLTFGFLFLILGAIGLLLPVLPTTPFVLLAAFCFSRGSERWHQWLLNNPYFGPGLKDWEQHGVIRRKPKRVATVLILISFGSLWFLVRAPLWAKISMVSVAVLVLLFIWSRPSEPV